MTGRGRFLIELIVLMVVVVVVVILCPRICCPNQGSNAMMFSMPWDPQDPDLPGDTLFYCMPSCPTKANKENAEYVVSREVTVDSTGNKVIMVFEQKKLK